MTPVHNALRRLFNRSTPAVAAVLVFLTLAQWAAAAGFKPDEVLVKLRSPAALATIVSNFGVVQTTQFGSRPIYRLRLPANSNVDTVVNQLTGNADVLLAEPNYTHDTPEARKNLPWAFGSAGAYVAQWAPAAMHLPEAHLFAKGAGVRVAVLDTGVDLSHPVLVGKLLPGYDFVDGDADPSEVSCTPTPCSVAGLGYGHGTHVAGLIALAAPLAKIIPYRVLDPNGEGNAWVLVEALQRAIDPDGNAATNDGAHVINMSLGTATRTRILASIAKLFTCEPPDDTDPLLNFSDAGYDNDKARCANGTAPVIVAAAGNDGNSSVKEYPAAESVYGLISVGASNDSRRLATFSNSGSWVQVAAPGEGITSAIPTAASPSGFGTWSGTSMASPLVAGAVALLRSAQPEMAARDVVRRVARMTTPLIGTNIEQVNAAAIVEVCTMDVDGDGVVLPTTDGLILMRAMMGMTDVAVSSAASPTALRKNWTDIRRYLVDACGMNLP